ncbi:MAG: FAD-binding and (Fe-S)-binding domain-containing protein, partial [Parachlamydiaceae bacterium]
EADLRHHGIGYAFSEVTQKEKMKDVWEVRKGGLGLLMSKRSYVNACAFLEDMTIPPAKLHDFMKRFFEYLAQYNKEAGVYGHVGSGCMHIRPYLNLQSQDDLDLIARMMETFSSIVIEYGGALSGEHGDGIIRSGYNEKMFGAPLYKGFQELKDAFDPFHLMNPGKIVGGLKFEELQDKLKIKPSTVTRSFDTFYDFEKEGGFALAVDLCNGNGKCRKKESLMCPSFQATLNEYDSTRARANALQAMIHESLSDKSLANPDIHDILDLCLSCKGCKTECPSQVDMAKMKSEFLYHYQKQKGIPLRSRLIANIAHLNEWAMPSLQNWLVKQPFVKKILKKIGFSPSRTLPSLSSNRFSELFYRIKQPEGKKVVLFNDTYTQFNHPEIGESAIAVLNKLGYEVIVP